MADEDNLVEILSDEQLRDLGITKMDAEQYPELQNVSDILHYAATDACRKGLVGVDGTNIQMINVIGENKRLMIEQVCLFLLKNQIKPLESVVVMLTLLVETTADLLGEGDMHAVNRRRQLTINGVLKPRGDDIVPDTIRALWV